MFAVLATLGILNGVNPNASDTPHATDSILANLYF